MNDPQTTALAKEGIKELVQAAEKFLGKLVTPGLEEGGGIIQDSVKFWRFKNQVNIALKAEKFLRKKGIKPQQILPKTLVPLLEDGSLENNDEMQSKWAALLANAANPKSKVSVKPSFPGILKELSPLEAKLLDQLFDNINKQPKGKRFQTNFAKDKILQFLKVTPDEFDVIADNLFRLNLCQPPASFGGVSIGKFPIVLRTYDVIMFTPLGYEFVKACRFN